MSIVPVSADYQIIIPKAIRESFDIQPGQKLAMVLYKGQIALIPVMAIADAQGLLEAIDTTVQCDEDRE